ncbi:MAG: HAMP domain-containing histidine kinase [Deltaproteobacteria bacterium]|nr:MAG: HAMP domain-containing histidine kinase [Deltaproteobacteria bacterium]
MTGTELEAALMSDSWDETDRSEARAGRARRRRRRSREPDASEETRAYREARIHAERKVRAARDVLGWALGSLLLVWIFRWLGFLIAVVWGVRVCRRAFGTLIAPDLRERWTREEVVRQLSETMPRERVELEEKHARSVEQLSASIAHEIRNPITAAKSLVQQMDEDPTAKDNVEYARVALEELDRVERSISHLLRFAREEDIQVRDLRLADVLDSALETFRDRLTSLGVAVERDVDVAGEMRGDPEQLRRVIINLVGNALDALEEAAPAEARMRVELGENLAGTEVWLRIRDNGPGMDARSLEKIFTPLYTSKRQGTGLGLAISKKVVDRHGGSIEAHSQPQVGTEFLLTLPKRGPGAGGHA